MQSLILWIFQWIDSLLLCVNEDPTREMSAPTCGCLISTIDIHVRGGIWTYVTGGPTQYMYDASPSVICSSTLVEVSNAKYHMCELDATRILYKDQVRPTGNNHRVLPTQAHTKPLNLFPTPRLFIQKHHVWHWPPERYRQVHCCCEGKFYQPNIMLFLLMNDIMV